MESRIIRLTQIYERAVPAKQYPILLNTAFIGKVESVPMGVYITTTDGKTIRVVEDIDTVCQKLHCKSLSPEK